jgi:hypothetical protein
MEIGYDALQKIVAVTRALRRGLTRCQEYLRFILLPTGLRIAGLTTTCRCRQPVECLKIAWEIHRDPVDSPLPDLPSVLAGTELDKIDHGLAF